MSTGVKKYKNKFYFYFPNFLHKKYTLSSKTLRFICIKVVQIQLLNRYYESNKQL
jgi:hypothetical protein